MSHACEGSVYDVACIDCCVRLVASCRSEGDRRTARKQQEGMLAYIERHMGSTFLASVIEKLKRGNGK